MGLHTIRKGNWNTSINTVLVFQNPFLSWAVFIYHIGLQPRYSNVFEYATPVDFTANSCFQYHWNPFWKIWASFLPEPGLCRTARIPKLNKLCISSAGFCCFRAITFSFITAPLGSAFQTYTLLGANWLMLLIILLLWSKNAIRPFLESPILTQAHWVSVGWIHFLFLFFIWSVVKLSVCLV